MHGSGSSVDQNRISMGYIGSKICSFHFVRLLKAHMDLNGIQRFYGLMRSKFLDNKFQVLTNT